MKVIPRLTNIWSNYWLSEFKKLHFLKYRNYDRTILGHEAIKDKEKPSEPSRFSFYFGNRARIRGHFVLVLMSSWIFQCRAYSNAEWCANESVGSAPEPLPFDRRRCECDRRGALSGGLISCSASERARPTTEASVAFLASAAAETLWTTGPASLVAPHPPQSL